MVIVVKKVNELHPSEYNPRQATGRQKVDIRRSLEKFGFVDIINDPQFRKKQKQREKQWKINNIRKKVYNA